MPEVSLSSEDAPRSEEDDTSIWSTGSFRLFLSHHTSIKVPTHNLKIALLRYGIDSFVAHDYIKPTKDWQSVIEGALRAMDALVALVNEEFRASKWCDQEVGVAIGRDRLVIPVRLGVDPYGFMGRYQGVQGKGLQPAALANKLLTAC